MDQLQQQVDQLKEAATGTSAVRASKQSQLQLAEDELSVVSGLAEKGYATRSQALGIEREVARLNGEIGEHDAGCPGRNEQSRSPYCH